ncbi:MAG: T9SS type A sorting domain-containing protein [Bacteroidia bacterium]
MNKILTKLILSTFVLLCTFGAKAQDIDSLYIDSTDNEFSTVHMLDSVFKNVDLLQVPTGILIDKALITANITDFNGTLHDSNMCSTFLWRRLWASLHRAHVDTAISKDTTELYNLVDTLRGYLNAGLVPITLLNYQYSRIKESAFENNLFYMEGIQVFDEPLREESPYENATCFAAAAAIDESDSLTVHYIVPSLAYFTNDTAAIDTLQIDFGDGLGYRTVNFDEEIIIVYDTAVEVEINVRVVTNSTERLSHFFRNLFGIGASSDPKFDDFEVIEAVKIYPEEPEPWSNGKGIAFVSIHYQCSNNENKKLRRPFIVVGGYEFTRNNFGSQHYTGPKYGRDYFFKNIGRISPTIYNEIISQEYDLVFVDFARPTDYLQRNAYALEEVIKWVNEEKAANGSTAPNVIMGHSMGGVVARYALGEMHAEHLANPTTEPHHDTRVFYTHDSPHLGVNVPVGTQVMIKMMTEYYLNINQLSIVEHEDLFWNHANLTSQSGRQMLIHDIYAPNTPNPHSLFYSELDAIAPLDELGCKAILICDGSGAGVPQGKGVYVDETSDLPLWDATKAGDKILRWNKYMQRGVNFKVDLYATPDGTGSMQVFEGGFENAINNQYYKRYSVKGDAYASMTTALDGAPGSFMAASELGLSGGIYNSIKNYIGPNYANIPVCFIPSISSSAYSGLSGSNLFYTPINGSAIPSNYKFFLTRDDMGTLPEEVTNKRNGLHVAYTPHSAELLQQDWLKMVPETLSSGAWFNYGPPVSDRIGTTLIEDEATLHINSDEDIGLYNTDIRYTVHPVANSTYRVETKQFENCTAQPSTITIEGDLVLGDNTNNLSGELVIRPTSKLILKNGANVTLHNNSKLIIQENAELEIEDGVTFNLIDANSEVVIRGILTMQSNAEIVLATGDGNLRFDCPENAYCSTQFVGNNTISLTGAGRTDKVLVVTGKGLDLTGVVSLSLTTGKVELGTNTEIVVDGSLILNTVKVTKLTGLAGDHVYNGIVINSLTGKTISIQHSRFEYAQIGLTKSSTSTITPLSLTETTFGYCTYGLKTFGGGCTLSKVRFDNCGIGWKATDMSATSEFNGFAENNISAIEYAGNSSAHLYVYESTFRDNKEEEDDLGTAIIASGEFYLTLGCNHFIENDNDVIFAHGDLFLTGSVAGNNYFNNTLINTLYLDNVNTVSLSGGDNEFIYTSNPQKVFTGTINSGITTVAMSNNYWKMLNGSTIVYDLNAALATVVNSSSASVTCSTATVETTADICEETWEGTNVFTEKITRVPQKKPAPPKAAVQLYTLYPNPASNTLFLKATSGAAERNLTVKAIDVMGKTIILQGKSEFDISQLAVGMYQIIVEQNGHILHKQKLVVSR